MAEEKAQRLRMQANQLAQEHGITDDVLTVFDMAPDEMAPLDENGIPKYKGRKRGRKPKKRKRQVNPNRRRRQHTAYTLFVQENYPQLKQHHPELQSKDIIGMVARQWAGVAAEQKHIWKQRAMETHHEDDEAMEEGIEEHQQQQQNEEVEEHEEVGLPLGEEHYHHVQEEEHHHEEVEEQNEEELQEEEEEEEHEELQPEEQEPEGGGKRRRVGRPRKQR